MEKATGKNQETMRHLSKIELENTINMARGLDKAERMVFLGCFDTQELIDEVNRRTKSLESIYIDLCNELSTVGEETSTQNMEKLVVKLRRILRVPVE